MFGLRSSLEIFVNRGLGCTTIGEHHVTGSPLDISSNMSSAMPCSNHVLMASVDSMLLVLAFVQQVLRLVSY